LALAMSLYLLRWFWLQARAVRCGEDAVLMLFLLVIGNHALLELPLHYAYFLLPAGLVIGVLNVRLNARPILSTGRWSLLWLWLPTIALLALIIRDYLKVETSYQELRFEQARIKVVAPGKVPEVLLLTQFGESFRFARLLPTSGMSADDLDWMRKVSKTYPGSATLPKLALALALNKQPDEAQLWLEKVCRIESELRCSAVKNYWANQSLKHPELAAVPWPN
jgi:hypothetical protein